ncbi:hypothetical protein ACRS6B_08715 [Nocardia asteroides]
MSGFDDRRDDPTILGRPAGPPTPRQPLSGASRFAPPPTGDADGARPSSAPPHPVAPSPESSPWQSAGYESGRPAVTPWQRGPLESSTEHAPTFQWQPVAAPPDFGQPEPVQWQPNDETTPTTQWRPGGQSDPATAWASPTGPASNTPEQAEPTILAQSLGNPQPGVPPTGRDDPTMLGPSVIPSGGRPSPHGRNDPTMLGQPLGALDQSPSFGRAPGSDDSAPTLLGYPSGDRFGPPAQTLQWQPVGGPGPYGGPYPPGYGPQEGFGGPPSQPNHPDGSGRGKLVLSAGLAVLLVAGLVAGVVALTRLQTDDPAQDTPPAMVNALTTAAASPTRATTKPAPTTTTRASGDKTPVIPGYQVVRSPDSGAAYDVPAGWTIAPPSTIGGFGEPPNAVAGKGLASEGKGYCPGSTRTVAFLTGSSTSDPGKAATELGTKTATLAYKATPGGTPGAPAPLASLDGSQHGMFVETKGTVADAKPGCAKAYSVYTVAFPNDNGTFVMVIAADTGVPNALDAETAKRIFTSIRPIEG